MSLEMGLVGPGVGASLAPSPQLEHPSHNLPGTGTLHCVLNLDLDGTCTDRLSFPNFLSVLITEGQSLS